MIQIRQTHVRNADLFCSPVSIIQPGHRLSSREHVRSFPIDLATIFGREFFTFDSQDLAIIGKWSPENFGIKKNNPLENSNESMIPPCPCSFDKNCRTAECFETTKVPLKQPNTE